MKPNYLLFVLLALAPIGAAANMGANTPGASKTGVITSSNSQQRGHAGQAAGFRQHQLQQHYMTHTPDVDTACRQRIYECLAKYCGDMTVVPGVYEGRCQYASEGELYNWALLCISRDFTDLMPQYNIVTRAQGTPVNTVARLCPPFVQQEIMNFLSMSMMAGRLAQQRSAACMDARAELAAALSCHQTTMIYANESSSLLESMLTASCGAGVLGGSRAMVQQFLNAGNVGGDVWGWVNKLISLDASKKAAGWETRVDTIAAGFVNRMNAACGENMQFQAVQHRVDTSPTLLQQAATALVSHQLNQAFTDPNKLNAPASGGATAFPGSGGGGASGKAAGATQILMTVNSNYAIHDFATASQVVQAALTNPITTQNPFLTSAQMQQMQQGRRTGTKVFMIKDHSRCFIIAVEPLTDAENKLVAPHLASCAHN